MAASLKASGTWAEFTADGSVTIPGTPAAGDRMYLWAVWKAFGTTAQVTSAQACTEVTEFTDGAVAAGANVGSVKVGCWYRDWQSGDGNPTLDWSAAPAPGVAVIEVWQKASSELWDTPTFVTAAIAAATTWSATSSSTITVKDAAVIFELAGFRDDSSTMTRSATTALEDDGSPNVTWNGNVVESPATHISTTTSNDISADLVHRFVTTGAAGVNLTATGTLAASETGAVLWVHQGLTAAEEHSGSFVATGGGVLTSARRKGGRRTGAYTGGGTTPSTASSQRRRSGAYTGGGATPVAQRSARSRAQAHTGGGVATTVAAGGRSGSAGARTGGGVVAHATLAGRQLELESTGGGVVTWDAAAESVENHDGSFAATGGGQATVAATSSRSAAAAIAGGGVVSSSGAGQRGGAQVATGGGQAAWAASTQRSSAHVATGGGVHELEAEAARRGAAALSGGGVLTLAQATQRAGALGTLTGGGTVAMAGTSAENHNGTMAATGGGAVALAAITARLLELHASGGGLAGAAATSARQAAWSSTGGGAVAIEGESDQLEPLPAPAIVSVADALYGAQAAVLRSGGMSVGDRQAARITLEDS